jgi:hypothetical protein
MEDFMKKRFLLRVFFACFLLVAAISLGSCGNPDEVKSVALVETSVPEVIYTDEVSKKLTEIQIEVTKGDKSVEVVNITKNMIDNLSSLTKVGTHTVNILYEGYKVELTLIIETRPIITVEVTYTEEVIINNLQSLTELPEEPYDLYVWSWIEGIQDTGGAFYPCANGKFEVPEEYNGVVFLLMPKGMEPAWDTKMDQTFDLEIHEGVVREIGGSNEIVKATYTVDMSLVESNLKPKTEGEAAVLPEEGTYDLYAYVWGGKKGDQWILVEDGSFEADETISGCLFAFVTKGYTAEWASVIIQTNDFNATAANGVGTLTPKA